MSVEAELASGLGGFGVHLCDDFSDPLGRGRPGLSGRPTRFYFFENAADALSDEDVVHRIPRLRPWPLVQPVGRAESAAVCTSISDDLGVSRVSLRGLQAWQAASGNEHTAAAAARKDALVHHQPDIAVKPVDPGVLRELLRSAATSAGMRSL